MEWGFLGGLIIGFVFGVFLVLVLYRLFVSLDAVNDDTPLGDSDRVAVVMERKFARYLVKTLDHDARPSVVELVKRLRRSML